MSLDRTALVAAASAATGLDDFDGDGWQEGLDRLVHSLLNESNLNELGHAVAESQITTALTTRLRIIDWHRNHPEMADSPVAAPIMILGQPRTGTTILFDLLAQDPGLRAPLTWEVSDPVPPPQTATYDSDPRIAVSEATTGASEAIIPGFQAIHPSGARRAQECVAITAGDFKSLQWPTVFRSPSYARWLINDADLTSAYRYHKQFLQVLQAEHPAERWILKTPAHQWHLAEMFAAYPDATIIHTHRDPLKVVASVSSLMSVLHKLGTDEPNLPEIAEEWIDYLVEGNNRAVTARHDGTVADEQAIDVAFADLMTDTFATIGQIYEQLGRPFTPEAEAAMRQFLEDNPRDKHGRHKYTFAATGLDLDASRARTASYEDHFSVPQEILPAE